MDAFEIRNRNFHYLFEQFKDSIRRQWPDQPERGMSKLFAEKLDLNPKYFGLIKQGRRNIGEDIARRIEACMDLPHGWMDVDHTGPGPETQSEKEFVEAALALFRQNEGAAQQALIRLFNQKMSGQPTQ